MEIALRRLDGVDKVTISIQQQAFSVTLKPGSSFDPQGIRDAVAQADVSILRFYVESRGQVEQKGDERFFVAGKDRFLLAASPDIPIGELIWVNALVDDSTDPLQMRVNEHKPLEP